MIHTYTKKLISFRTLVLSFCVLVLILIGLFIHLNAQKSLMVKDFQLNGETHNAEFNNQLIKITFNRPLRIESEDYLLIQPEISFNQFVQGKVLTIQFNKSLDFNTDYVIKIGEGLVDIYGNSYQGVFEFRTKDLMMYFLTKNVDNQDTISAFSFSQKSAKEIIKGENIYSYNIKGSQLVLIEEINNFFKATLHDLESDKAIDISGRSFNIPQADFSPLTGTFYFLGQRVTFEGDFVLPQQGKQLFRYDFTDNTNQVVSDIDVTLDIEQFIIDPTENYALIKDSYNSLYYLLDLNDKSTIPIGRFIDSGGFSESGDKIIFSKIEQDFLSFPHIAYVDSNKDETLITTKDEYSFDGSFAGDLILSARKHKDLDESQRIMKVVATREDEVVFEITDEQLSFEIPKADPTFKFVTVEAYTIDDFKDFSNQRVYNSFFLKPKTAKIFIYEIDSGELLDYNLNGIEIKWN